MTAKRGALKSFCSPFETYFREKKGMENSAYNRRIQIEGPQSAFFPAGAPGKKCDGETRLILRPGGRKWEEYIFSPSFTHGRIFQRIFLN